MHYKCLSYSCSYSYKTDKEMGLSKTVVF